VLLSRDGDGAFSCITSVPKPTDQLNTKDWGLWLRPRKEDLVNGSQHVNTRIESSTSSGHKNVTLISFTAEVTMGAALYAEWAKGGKFNMPGLSQLAEMANDHEALPHTTKYLSPGNDAVDLAGGKAQMPFAVYLLNDSVNSMEYVNKTLEQACSLTAQEAMAAMLLAHNEGKAVVFRASAEDEALEVQAKLQQAGLTTEVQRVEH